jgi:predicted nucleotidyltransferase
MRFEGVPERLLGTATAVRTLRVLLAFPDRELTGREIARMAGAPPVRVIERLRVLEWEGLVTRRTVGAAHFWKLETGHFLARQLAAIFKVDTNAQAEFRAMVRHWADLQPAVVEVRLFGSVARKDERPASDIDLLLVVANDKAREAAIKAGDGLADRVRVRFGNPLHLVVLTRQERTARAGTGFVGEADREGELLFSRGA